MTKKIILSAAIFGAVFMFGQERQKLTPEQREAKKAEMVQKAKERQQAHLDKMTTELNLSKKQVEQIKALQEKNNAEREANRAKMEEVRKQRQQEMQAKRDAHDAKMKKILSPEQYDKWQKQRLENMQKQRDAWKNKAMRKGGKQGGMKPQNSPQ